MAHVTLSIPDDVYQEMKRYPEIKWSEIVRQSIMSYFEGMKDTTSSQEIRNLLSENTLSKLSAINPSKARSYYKKSEREEWKRAKSLTRTC